MSSYTYRKIWGDNFGKIPTDDRGRVYEIHHKDGNRSNNSIENLMCVSIQEHFDIHAAKGEWGAATLIAKRMGLPTDYISTIQTGKKRPELVGKCGPKKGNIPWNKGVVGYSLNTDRIGKRFTSKLNELQVNDIRKNYREKVKLKDYNLVNTISKNGRLLTYDRLFCKEYSESYNVSVPTIKNIIYEKYWTEGIVDVRK